MRTWTFDIRILPLAVAVIPVETEDDVALTGLFLTPSNGEFAVVFTKRSETEAEGADRTAYIAEVRAAAATLGLDPQLLTVDQLEMWRQMQEFNRTPAMAEEDAEALAQNEDYNERLTALTQFLAGEGMESDEHDE